MRMNQKKLARCDLAVSTRRSESSRVKRRWGCPAGINLAMTRTKSKIGFGKPDVVGVGGGDSEKAKGRRWCFVQGQCVWEVRRVQV